jgi:hypothetical protein
MSPNNWLNFLNLDFDAANAQSAASMPNNNNTRGNEAMLSGGFDFSGLSNSPLSDDLKAQLEAWTNVSFGGDDSAAGSAASRSQQQQQQQYFQVMGTEDAKKDPSPYAKRPFGNFSSSYQALERSFDAFGKDGAGNIINHAQATQSDSSSATPILADTPGSGDFVNHNAQNSQNSNNSNNWQSTLPIYDFTKEFPVETTAFPLISDYAHNHVQPQQQQQQHYNNTPVAQAQGYPQSQPQSQVPSRVSTPAVETAALTAPSAKRQRTSASSFSPSDPARSESEAAAREQDSYINAEGVLVKRQPLLTKAAILAQQLEELKNKHGRTPEEEAIRQAELNRIAAEDDKRRRNTAASARFRVKKKAREAALEDTINELKGKISGLEHDLSKTKNENSFLRDLVIRKVCSLPSYIR